MIIRLRIQDFHIDSIFQPKSMTNIFISQIKTHIFQSYIAGMAKKEAINRPDAKTVLMFALSADAFVEDERLSAESGMNGHFAKPVDFAALQRSIGKFLRQRRG